MDIEGTTVLGIDKLVRQLNRAIADVSEKGVKEELKVMRGRLDEMRVALEELENVEEKHSRGDITPDHYFVQRKKLMKDFFTARNEVADSVVPNIADRAPSAEEKGRLMRFREWLKGNKEFVAVGLDFLLTVVKAFVMR